MATSNKELAKAPTAAQVAKTEKRKALANTLRAGARRVLEVASKYSEPEQVMASAILQLQKNEALLDCTPVSFLRAVAHAAEVGVSLAPALGHGYLVPRKIDGVMEVCFQIGYMGLEELCYRGGFVKAIRSRAVYKQDEFEIVDGTTSYIRHVPGDHNYDQKDITGVWAIVELVTGASVSWYMTRAQVDRIRNASPGKNALMWSEHYAEGARKTCLRNLLKHVPKSLDLARAMSHVDAEVTGDTSLLDSEFLDDPVETVPTKGVTAVIDEALSKRPELMSGEDYAAEIEEANNDVPPIRNMNDELRTHPDRKYMIEIAPDDWVQHAEKLQAVGLTIEQFGAWCKESGVSDAKRAALALPGFIKDNTTK